MSRAERRRLARLVRGLEDKAEATRQAFAEQGRPGRRLYQAERLTIEQALAHPPSAPVPGRRWWAPTPPRTASAT